MQFVLCEKSTCPKIESCYRFRALVEEGEYQEYNPFPKICNEEDNYKLFIRIHKDDKVKELNSMKNIIEQSENENFQPNTPDDLRFINHVEDELIDLDKKLKEDKTE